MATIYPNKKDGKQIFRCKNWIPEKDMTEKKLLALAEKGTILFESKTAL